MFSLLPCTINIRRSTNSSPTNPFNNTCIYIFSTTADAMHSELLWHSLQQVTLHLQWNNSATMELFILGSTSLTYSYQQNSTVTHIQISKIPSFCSSTLTTQTPNSLFAHLILTIQTPHTNSKFPLTNSPLHEISLWLPFFGVFWIHQCQLETFLNYSLQK